MNFENISVRAKEVYPEIVNAKVDPMTVKILKNLSNTAEGELNAILQYTYQHIMSAKIAEEVSVIIKEIAIVEMRHMDLLNSAIVEFGGAPCFDSAKGQFYSASLVNYTPRLIEMLRANILGEKAAIRDYTYAAEHVSNESLRCLLLRIREDEELHLKDFQEMEKKIVFFSACN